MGWKYSKEPSISLTLGWNLPFEANFPTQGEIVYIGTVRATFKRLNLA
jgi:hypothetical protein